jgi:hypothetical protein
MESNVVLRAIARAFTAPLFMRDEPAPVNGTMDGVGEGVRTFITRLGLDVR